MSHRHIEWDTTGALNLTVSAINNNFSYSELQYMCSTPQFLRLFDSGIFLQQSFTQSRTKAMLTVCATVEGRDTDTSQQSIFNTKCNLTI